MDRKSRISDESENERSSEEYSQKNNTSIDVLNNDCLEYIFKFLPIADRMRLEKGEY
jgi:hypothetical protein